MTNESVTLKINEETKDKIIEFYTPFAVSFSDPYVIFMAKFENVNIKIYQNTKGEYKALFSGKDSLKEACIFDESAEINVAEPNISKNWLDELDQIGSDEVGVGDLFGPIVVVACYLSTKDIEYLKELKIDDSKKFSDTKIREIAPLLMNKLVYSCLVMDNEKLNSCIENGDKKLMLEAKMHNQAHLNVLNKVNKYLPIYIDQFIPSSTYYYYLSGETIAPNAHFKTKGESYYPSVAASSIIARYRFLKYMDELNEKYKTKFPFGANKNVDEFLKEFIDSHGYLETKKLVKAHFTNFKKYSDLSLFDDLV